MVCQILYQQGKIMYPKIILEVRTQIKLRVRQLCTKTNPSCFVVLGCLFQLLLYKLKQAILLANQSHCQEPQTVWYILQPSKNQWNNHN